MGLAAGDLDLMGDLVASVTRPGVPIPSSDASSRLASEIMPWTSADAAASLAALRARLASFSSGVRCFFLSLSLSLDFFFFLSRCSSPPAPSTSLIFPEYEYPACCYPALFRSDGK